MQEPGVGANLLVITEWLENLSSSENDVLMDSRLLRQWAKRRVLRLNKRLATAQQASDTLAQQHRVRIHAKRLRYGVNALRDLLPERIADFCNEKAAILQTNIGAKRDLLQASVLVATLASNPGLVDYLRGVVIGAGLTDASGLPASK